MSAMVQINGCCASQLAIAAGSLDYFYTPDGWLICNDISQVQLESALLTFDFLTSLKNSKINEVYQQCSDILELGSESYAPSEIAIFPLLQDEIIAYNADNLAIGAQMQKIIDRGRHTAASLSAVITPKIMAENATLLARDNHISAISALTTIEQVNSYTITF